MIGHINYSLTMSGSLSNNFKSVRISELKIRLSLASHKVKLVIIVSGGNVVEVAHYSLSA